MNKHTQGPWSIQYGVIQGGEGHAIVDSNDTAELSRIADVLFHDDTEGETKANAMLIAAAPELLAALQGLFGNFGEFEYDLAGINKARLAISKATEAA